MIVSELMYTHLLVGRSPLANLLHRYEDHLDTSWQCYDLRVDRSIQNRLEFIIER